MELSLLRQRSLEALRQKARRGELFLGVAGGYVKVRHDRIAKDPDRRVQEAIGLVFRKFAEFESIRQVHLWLRQEDVRLPAVEVDGDGRRVVWKLPVYSTVHRLLTNPIYGGAYAFGRTGSRVTVENGRKRVRRGLSREREQWDVLIVDHHEGYVSWAEYERNQRVIADNAARYGLLTRGAVRRGEGLLAGLLRCGHCGRRLHVAYSGIKGKCVRYSCRGAHLNHGTSRCIAFGGMRVDAAVANEVLRLLRPLGIEAALQAIAMRDQEHADRRHHAELALTQARYEADLARRQYDAVDPANRLVGAELERRWNERLAEVQRQEERVASIADARPEALSSAERDRLLALGADLETVWTHPGATAQTRKRIVRAVLEEIVVKLAAEHIELLLHWRGGDHTHLSVPRNRTGQHRWCTDATVGDLIRGLAHQLPDRAIAATLKEPPRRPPVRGPRSVVGDRGREKLQEPLDGHRPHVDDHRGQRDRGRAGPHDLRPAGNRRQGLACLEDRSAPARVLLVGPIPPVAAPGSAETAVADTLAALDRAFAAAETAAGVPGADDAAVAAPGSAETAVADGAVEPDPTWRRGCMRSTSACVVRKRRPVRPKQRQRIRGLGSRVRACVDAIAMDANRGRSAAGC